MAAISSFMLTFRGSERCLEGPTRVQGGVQEEEIVEWVEVWRGCEKRLNHWRVPPRWSRRDWQEEMRAEGAAAALGALERFRPELNVPLKVYLRMRIMGQVLARYRKEWSYALRQGVLEWGLLRVPLADSERALMANQDVTEALAHLDAPDRCLIERIFWLNETEAEIGRTLGLTQQAVNKRKKSIIRTLRLVIESDRN